MKKIILLFTLAALSALSGYLMSKVSLVGRAGMSFFYQTYNFLKVWWQGAVLVFVVLVLLYLLQGSIFNKAKKSTSLLAQSIFLFIAFVGLYLTFYNFRHTLSHRWLGERFHLGAYLFWLGWMLICLYYLLQKKSIYPGHLEAID